MLRLADQSVADGEVQRFDGVEKLYSNLIKVEPPITFIEATVFTKLTRFEVAGWESLKPYTIGIIRGIKFAERHTKRMNAVAVKDYVALAPRISAVFEEMRASGELARLRDHVIVVLLNLAEKGMPLCDDDYACFETPPD